MPSWQKDTFKRSAGHLIDTFRGGANRRKVVQAFAKKHDLIYFQSVHPDSDAAPVLRGTTVSIDQVDTNYCIGSHAGYDMAMVERLATVEFTAYKPSIHRWYVLQIDLKQAHTLPFVFLGTKQQSKAYYARILTAHRNVRYLSLNSGAKKTALFHATYALLSSPVGLPLLYRLFTDDIINDMASFKRPFAIEIDGDSLMVITESQKPNEKLFDELLHYGLWLAKTIDEKLA